MILSCYHTPFWEFIICKGSVPSRTFGDSCNFLVLAPSLHNAYSILFIHSYTLLKTKVQYFTLSKIMSLKCNKIDILHIYHYYLLTEFNYFFQHDILGPFHRRGPLQPQGLATALHKHCALSGSTSEADLDCLAKIINWATACKTVRPMLPDHCPVCLSCLSRLSCL